MLIVTLIFRGDRASPSESHVDVKSTSVDQAATTALNMVQARAAILGVGASIAAVRITDTTVPGVSNYLDPATYIHDSGNPDQPGIDTMDFVGTSVRMRCFGASAQKNWYVSCPPDNTVVVDASRPGDLDLTGQFGTFWPKLRAALLASYGFPVKVLTGKLQVQSVVTSAVAPITIGLTTAAQLMKGIVPIGNGDKVYVKGFRRVSTHSPGINGRWKVQLVLAPTVVGGVWTYYLVGSQYVAQGNIVGLGQISPIDHVGTPYLKIVPVAAGKRSRGNSFGLRRGTSSRVR
jgi:hypothetical protein